MTRLWTPPGQIGELRLERRLGAGAQGQVWLARDTLLERRVAVKFPAAPALGEAGRGRIVLEAQALARVRHRNVVCVYASGAVEGRPYIVTELLDGTPLDARPRPLPAGEAIAVVIDVARGLAAAHRAGILHRDVKPQNALVCAGGVVKLVDFGLAVREEDAPSDGDPAGTPLYLPPEAWRGAPPSRAADVYAVGVMLYHLVSGRFPTDARSLSELRAGAEEPPAPLVEDALLAPVVAACLARRAADRPSAEELCRMLERARGTPSLPAPSPGGSPYPGLRPFDAGDAPYFFGREGEIAAVLDALRRAPALVAVVGPSGCGKSSLVRAGVLPHLGEVPLLCDPPALPDAARLRAGRALVVVDPLDAAIEREDWRAFLEECLERTPAVRLLVTLRADALARLEALGPIRDELLEHAVLIGPPPAGALREAIVAPAARLGFRFESDDMVDELAGAGSLPLLAFTLEKLWQARDGERRVLPAGALAHLGGLAGALAGHADAVIASLPPPLVDEARRLLVSLVDADGRRAAREEDELGLAARPGARAALSALVAGRLVVAREGERGPAHELAHDVLLSGWPRLCGWLSEDAAARAARDRVRRAAAEWIRLGRGSEGLLSERLLSELPETALVADERALVVASRRAARRRAIRRWLPRLGLPVALGAAVAAAGLVVKLEERARERGFVAARLAAAGDALRAADALAAGASAARAVAFALFDAGAPAEETWAATRALAASASASYLAAASETDAARKRAPRRLDARAAAALVLSRWLELAEVERAGPLARELRGRLEALGVPPSATAAEPAPRVPDAAARMVLVPGGTGPYGSPDEDPVRRALGAPPEHPVATGAFLIGRLEVTFGDWLELLDALPAAEAARHRPRGDGVDLAADGSRLALVGVAAARGEPWCRHGRCVDWTTLPVSGISAADARLYARWLDETHRLPRARLCLSREWERAARGPRGRRYASGDSADGTNVLGDPAVAGPAPVGTHPADASPFAVLDLTGNVYEWVDGVAGPVLRGGAWDAPPIAARAYAETPAPDERYVSVGMRVCASP